MEVKLKFFEGRRGDVIARLPSGKIAVVNRRSRITPRPGEKWLCRVDKEYDRFAIVTPIDRIVLKKAPEITKYACGHEEVTYVEVELPESEEPKPKIFESVRECPECVAKQEREFQKIISDLSEKIEEIDKEFSTRKIMLEEIIVNLNNEIVDLKSSMYINLPALTPKIPGAKVKSGKVMPKTFTCRYCGREIELKEGEITCKCGAKYIAKKYREVEEGLYEKAWEHMGWTVTDLRRKAEVEQEIEEIEKKISEFDRELTKLKAEYNEQLIKLAKSEGIVDYIHDLENRKVTVTLQSGEQIKMEWDEGVVIPPTQSPRMLRIAYLLEHLPVKR